MKLGERIAALLEPVFDRLGFLAVNAPAFFGPFTRHADIAYGSDPQHRLDVYVPDEAAAVLSPVVVFWHGGHWRFGDKRDYRFVGAALAGSGFNAVLPNYRHYPQVKMPGFMDDAARAALWSAAHAGDYGGDPRRLYLMGHSAGAHMAALLTLDARYLAAAGEPAPQVAGVVGLSGAYDFLPLLEAAGTADDPARVINVGSIDGLRVPEFHTYSYAASKAGLHQLTRVLARELGPRHITVNAVAPGPFESKMMAATLAARGDEIAAASPLGRIGRSDDMAGVAVFLSGRGSAYITGAVIPVDGGIWAAS